MYAAIHVAKYRPIFKIATRYWLSFYIGEQRIASGCLCREFKTEQAARKFAARLGMEVRAAPRRYRGNLGV